MMHRLVLPTVTLGLLASIALAQEAPQSQQAPATNEQRPAWRNGMAGGNMVGWFLRDVDENVPLTGQQKKQLQESLDKLRQEAMEQFRNNAPNPEMRETFRALRQQQEQAAAAGDEAQVQELQKQLDAAGPGNMFRQLRTRAMDEVARVLTSDQQQAFEQWRTLRESNLPPPLLNNPEALKDALKTIPTLTDPQRDTLETAFQRYDSQISTLGANEPVERNKIRNNLAQAIQKTLKPGQQILMMNSFRRQMMQRSRTDSSTQPAGQDSAPTPDASAIAASRAQLEPAPSGTTPQSVTRPEPPDTDAWLAYVNDFVTRYGLSEVERETAYNFLRELRTRRDIYLSSHRLDMAEIESKAKMAASPEQRAAIEQARKAIEQPVDQMFQELKDRLAVFLPDIQSTASQPAQTRPSASTQPSASSRPASARAPYPGSAAATQSARTAR